MPFLLLLLFNLFLLSPVLGQYQLGTVGKNIDLRLLPAGLYWLRIGKELIPLQKTAAP